MNLHSTARAVSGALLSCALFALALSAPAAQVVIGPFTNSVGVVDTNVVRIIPVSGPVANADGSFTTIGLPIRVVPTSDGSVTNTLLQNNYLATNAFLGKGILFRAPDDLGSTVYRMWDLRISGFNTFVTQTFGTNQPVTQLAVSNALGGFLPLSPAQTTNAILSVGAGLTNGATSLIYTNPAAVVTTNFLPDLTNVFALNSITNRLVTTNQLTAATNSLATTNQLNAATNNLAKNSVTNGLSPISYVATATNGAFSSATALVNSASNSIVAQIGSNGGASTNFVLGTVGNSTNDLNTRIQASLLNKQATNANLTGWAALATNLMASVNQLLSASNVLQGQFMDFGRTFQTNSDGTADVNTNLVLGSPGSLLSRNAGNLTNLPAASVVGTVSSATNAQWAANATNAPPLSNWVVATFAQTNQTGPFTASNAGNIFYGANGTFNQGDVLLSLGIHETSGNIVSNVWSVSVTESNLIFAYRRNTTNVLPSTIFYANPLTGLISAAGNPYITTLSTNAAASTNYVNASTNTAYASATTYAAATTNGLFNTLSQSVNTTNLAIASNPIYTASSNGIALYGAGSTETLGGTYMTNAALGCFTNPFTHFIISKQGPSWYVQWPGSGINSTNMYAHSGNDPWHGPWTVVNGLNPAPTSSPAYVRDRSGEINSGPFYGNGFGLTNVAQSLVALSALSVNAGGLSSYSGTISGNGVNVTNIATTGGAIQNMDVAGVNTRLGFATTTPISGGGGETAFGYTALQHDINGTAQTALGKGALQAITNGSGNVSIGYESTFNLEHGDYNLAIGQDALFSALVCDSNTAVGQSVMVDMITGQNNTGLGFGALAEGFTNGIGNTAIGTFSLLNLNAGAGNVAIGTHSGTNLVLGSGNILIGPQAQGPTTTSSGTLNIGSVLYASGLWTNVITAPSGAQSGKVGINVASPSSALEVNGDLVVTNGSISGLAFGNLYRGTSGLILPSSPSVQTLTNYSEISTNAFLGSPTQGTLTNLLAGRFAVSFDLEYEGLGNGTERIFNICTNGVSIFQYELFEYETSPGFKYHVGVANRTIYAPANTRWELKTTTADSEGFTNDWVNFDIQMR